MPREMIARQSGAGHLNPIRILHTGPRGVVPRRFFGFDPSACGLSCSHRMERLPGFRDFYPDPVPSGDALAWSAGLRQHIQATWRRVAQRYGFVEYDGPPLEPLELYTLKSGEEIVQQLYHFVDKGDRAVALRPEMTPTLARMVASQERHYKKPLKWFAIPQLFRYERQQKGRLREHFQFNADIVGESDPAADAEIIALLVDILRAFGLGPADVVVRISSRQAWQAFYRQQLGRTETDPAHEYAFYQVIDKLERTPREETCRRLRELGIAWEQVEAFLHQCSPTEELQVVLNELRDRGLQDFVQLDYRVIRGLAYYTGVVFEAFDCKGEFRAIAGGGRYDHLIHLVSGGRVDLPALGFGMGDVVLTELLKARGLVPAPQLRLHVFCLVEEPSLRREVLQLAQQLRDAGWAVDLPLGPEKPDKQFKRARDAGARFTVSLTREADGTKVAMVKDLQRREQIRCAPMEVLRRIQDATMSSGA